FLSTIVRPPDFYTLSLHDALPICDSLRQAVHRSRRRARSAGRPRSRADGDRSAARLGQRHGQAVSWRPRTLGEVLEERAAHAERSEEYTSELQSLTNLVCRLLLEQ